MNTCNGEITRRPTSIPRRAEAEVEAEAEAEGRAEGEEEEEEEEEEREEEVLVLEVVWLAGLLSDHAGLNPTASEDPTDRLVLMLALASA